MSYRIELIERLGTSTNGNPRYRLALSEMTPDGPAPIFLANTQSDADCSYDVGNRGCRVGDVVDITFTKAGRVSTMRAVKTDA